MHVRKWALLFAFSQLTTGCWQNDPCSDDAKSGTDEGRQALSRTGFNHDALESMRNYEGKDLKELEGDEREHVLSTLELLVPGRNYDPNWNYRPWRFWEFGTMNGRPAYLLLDANTSPHPGSTWIRLTLFDSSADPPFAAEFHTGHRCYLRGATREISEEFAHPLIILETPVRFGPGPAYYKQIYAWNGTRFDLVRLEDAEGEATSNDFADKDWQCGPPIPQQTAARWEEDLLSHDRLRILRALVWLGGTHRSLKTEFKADNRYERMEEVHLVHEVRQRHNVMARLTDLARSGHNWLREAAERAAKPAESSR